MSNEPEPLSPEDRELEAELKRLLPAAVGKSFLEELGRDQARIESVRRSLRQFPPSPLQNKWLLFTLAASFLVFCGLLVVALRQDAGTVPTTAAIPSGKEDEFQDRANVGRSAVPTAAPSFFPISSQGYLRKASSRGFIDSDSGPREQIEIDFDEVDHWHDPNTATNIRIYSPRREIIIIPVETY